MLRALPALAVGTLTAGVLAAIPPSAVSADDAPTHDVQISGAGIAGSWPAYDAGTDRYAIDTTSDSTGTITVTATSSDPAARVSIDGAVAPGGTAQLAGLAVGDEVNVQITDAGGTTNQSWIYLPADFPEMHVLADEAGQQPGHVFLTLSSFAFTSTFEAVVDHHGVPVMVDELNSGDLKVSDADPTQYSVARKGADGYDVVTLDDQWRPVSSRRLDEPAGRNSTDFHDSVLLPDGRALLMGYDATTHPGQTDAVIQVVDASGHATFTWDSADHASEADAYLHPGGDYAHINSLQMLPNGDVLASFRNLSQVMRIATTAHDGHEPGDVVWRLGGKDGDFTFVDDPLGGNCAQHMARILPNGHLMIFDNGSKYDPMGLIGPQTASMCPDPTDPDSPGTPGVDRPQTRVTEYALDEQARTATLVWSHAVPGRYAAFAGSQQRLTNGNTLVGWSFNTEQDGNQGPIVTEATPSGAEIWGLRATGWFSYRATEHDAPDRTAPVITLAGGPAGGTTYPSGAVVPALTYSCTDAGGSNLHACTGTVGSGSALPTTPGTHTVTVTATDGAGNQAKRSVTYTVAAPDAWQPDLRIRPHDGAWKGTGRTGAATPAQSVTVRLDPSRRGRTRKLDVQVRNAGNVGDRFTLRGTAGSRAFTVSYLQAGRTVTRPVTGGRFVTPLLAPGQTFRLRLVVTRTARARVGAERRVTVVAFSRDHRARRDAVSAVLRAVR